METSSEQTTQSHEIHNESCGCSYPVPEPATIAMDSVSAATPEAPKLTKKQIGQLRRQYVTVVHGTVKACGHKAKFSNTKQPTNNCVDCWKAFFITVVDLDTVHKVLTEQGVKAFEAKYGTKFMRNFHGFLATSLNPGATNEAV